MSDPFRDHRSLEPSAWSVQTYARIAGVLFLLTMIAGGFGEFYVPTRLIVSRDAAATATNITTSMSLFRLSFASYLVEAVCDIALAWIFYVLLRPVRRDLALLAAFFGLVSTATFAIAELFYFSVSFILGGADYLKTFSADQLNSLAMLSLKFYTVGGGVFMVFYGIACILRGYLIFRSDYLPKALGALLTLAGVGFVVQNVLLVLAPAYALDLLALPMLLAGLAMTVWFLTKGVDVAKWEEKATALQATL